VLVLIKKGRRAGGGPIGKLGTRAVGGIKMTINSSVRILLLACAAGGTAMAEDISPAEPACGEAQAHQQYRRSVHFSIKRAEAGFEYQCTLRKNKYRKKDPEVFRRQCEAFINEYIGFVNRCEEAGITDLSLDPSRDNTEEQDSDRFMKYTGFIEMS
jgi:hypothetical protein